MDVGIVGRFLCVLSALTLAVWVSGCSENAGAVAKKKSVSQTTNKNSLPVNARDQAGVFDPALYANATLSAGGRLYDKWWAASDLKPAPAAPTTTHPIWEQTGNKQTGDTTWRCASCHGWDYMGSLGIYGKSDSPFNTGIRGIVGTQATPVQHTEPASVFQFIHSGVDPTNGKTHSFGTMLSDSDIYNLTLFVVSMQGEAANSKAPRNLIHSDDGLTKGMEDMGKTVYTAAKADGGCADAACHGATGRAIDFTDSNLATLPNSFVDTSAQQDPWKSLHKIRFGAAGSLMPGLHEVPTVAQPQDAALDALAFAQNGLVPTTTVFDYRIFQDADARNSHVAWDIGRGGRLYDQWWTASSKDPKPVAPVDGSRHPLWPAANTTVGPATFRCANCHGWDYAGSAGALGNTDTKANPLYSAIKGVISTSASNPSHVSPVEIFDFLHSGQVTTSGDHAFAPNLSENDLYDLTRFIVTVQAQSLAKQLPASFVDTATGLAKGVNQTFGQVSYNALNNLAGCTECHDANGRRVPLDGTTNVFIREFTRNRGLEALHKIRFGLPDLSTGMYGLADFGYVLPGPAADILGYAQNGVGKNAVRGGRLYDDWMAESSITPPTALNPLLDMPNAPKIAGKDGWRCSSCHNYDFLGQPGYGNNLLELKSARNWDSGYIYQYLKNGRPTLNIAKHEQVTVHDFGALMSDTDLWDLAGFAVEQVVDTRRYFSARPFTAIGNSTSGQYLFSGGNNSVRLGQQQSSSCSYCHGADGKTVPSGSKQTSMDIFHTSWTDPLRFFHRARFGMPGLFGNGSVRMPGVLELNYSGGRQLDSSDAIDIEAYAQKMMTPGLVR